MALKIEASSLLEKHFLTVKSDGLTFYKGAIGISSRSFRFSQIECLLLAPDNKLSFQVGQEVFSIPTDPTNRKHEEIIATLVSELQRSAGRGSL